MHLRRETLWLAERERSRAGVKRGLSKSHSHAHGLQQTLDVFAVAVDAVAQVGGGAGVMGGAQGGGVAAGGEGMLRVQRGGGPALALAPALAFASLPPPLLSAGMHAW